MIKEIGDDCFGDAYGVACADTRYMVSFLRDDIYDEDGVLEQEAPKVYEDGGTLEMIRDRALMFLDKYNEEFPSKRMELVLFEDALRHMLRISRLIEMPRGSGLLVGVGGSGKQSLTRLASYISRATCFQITLTKQYNRSALMDDIRTLYKNAGHKRKPTTFLFTESEIKDEVFLETINSILSTGEVPGLFAKDEMMAMTSDLRQDFLRERPGEEETPDNMKQFFTDCVRDNLHIILCMSPMNPKFPVRARKFPGLVSSPTIDWFLAWPEEALVSVSHGFIKDFPLDCSDEVKSSLVTHMGVVHKMVTDVCAEYFHSMRRQVYQTPKSYLSFIAAYKAMYREKLEALKEKEGRVKLGLDKLIQGAADVEAMKVVLAAEQVKLEEATESTNRMLEGLEVSSAEAKAEGEQVAGIKARCEADAERIASEKESCSSDLAKAQPFVDEANAAINSIKPAHIGEIKVGRFAVSLCALLPARRSSPNRCGVAVFLAAETREPERHHQARIRLRAHPVPATVVQGPAEQNHDGQDGDQLVRPELQAGSPDDERPELPEPARRVRECRQGPDERRDDRAPVGVHRRRAVHAGGCQERQHGRGGIVHVRAGHEVLPRGEQDRQAQARGARRCRGTDGGRQQGPCRRRGTAGRVQREARWSAEPI